MNGLSLRIVNASYMKSLRKNEKIMKDIIHKNVKPANENDKMELIIYYRNIKTKPLIMKNNIASNNNDPLS